MMSKLDRKGGKGGGETGEIEWNRQHQLYHENMEVSGWVFDSRILKGSVEASVVMSVNIHCLL